MDEFQIENFRFLLNDLLIRLLEQAQTVKSELASQDSRAIEYLDRASVHTDQSMKLKIRSRESRLISKIITALERIEDNTYGLCEQCGEPISIKRLEARPVTSKCIACKTLEERREALAQ